MEWMRKPGKLTLNMNVNIANIPISLDNGKVVYRSLRWFRGASRYNNGGTIHGGKYRFRLLIGRAKQRKEMVNFW